MDLNTVTDWLKQKTGYMPQPEKQLPEGSSQGVKGSDLQTLLPMLGVVPPFIAMRAPRLNPLIPKSFNKSQEATLMEAIKHSGGELTPEGLNIHLTRFQKPGQERQPVRSGGVFYTPTKVADEVGRGYNQIDPKKDSLPFGGSNQIWGPTVLRNPLFVRGGVGELWSTAGKQLYGGHYDRMEQGALHYPKDEFFNIYAPRVKPYPDNTTTHPWNEFPWKAESALATKARDRGYDSIVPILKGEDRRNPYSPSVLGEVFDLRENRYPDKYGWYSQWPKGPEWSE